MFEGAKVLPPHLIESIFPQIVQHAINVLTPNVIENSVRITKRERQVIALIVDGSSNKEIAQKLNLSSYTVKSHVHNILENFQSILVCKLQNTLNLSDEYKTAANTTSLIDE